MKIAVIIEIRFDIIQTVHIISDADFQSMNIKETLKECSEWSYKKT